MRRFQSIRMMLGMLAIALIAKPAIAEREQLSRNESVPPSISADHGFIFFDGEYFSPPYKIEVEGDSIKINGLAIASDTFDLSSYQARDRGAWNGPGSPRGGQGEWPSTLGKTRQTDRLFRRNSEPDVAADPEAASIASKSATRRLLHEFDTLSQGVVVILRSDAKPLVLSDQQVQHELFKQLLAISETQTRDAVIPKFVVDETDRETWRHLVDTFQPTPAFVERASQQVEQVNEVQSQIEAQLVYRQWSEELIYPLTMLALVLVVVGLGHLMGSAHEVFSVTLNREEANDLSKNVIRLLVIMSLMSAIDLIWTVMAHQNGSMRELNPIGSKLIDDTSQLIAFKLFVTCLSIGLLFWLRRLPLTRKATWWCCLTMTLLTVRWLSFHSMLV